MSIERLFGGELPVMKMHGLGNHFIVYADFEEQTTPEIVRKLTNRNRGIGADGVVTVLNPRKDRGYEADFRMKFFNSNGEEAEMCGNGIRCHAKWLVDNKYCEKNKQMRIDTGKGLVMTEVVGNNAREALVEVNMGEPILYDPKQVALQPNKEGIVRFSEDIREFGPHPTKILNGIYVGMGNPHIVFIDQIEKGESREYAERYGRAIENYTSVFPQRTNVEFVEVNSRNDITMHVWERGEGLTQACGTGACASVVAARFEDKVDDNVTVHLPGGDLLIDWQGIGKPVYMIGTATNVGRINDLNRYLFARE